VAIDDFYGLASIKIVSGKNDVIYCSQFPKLDKMMLRKLPVLTKFMVFDIDEIGAKKQIFFKLHLNTIV